MPEKFYFVLPIKKPEVPERIYAEAKANGLHEKTECHISVIVEKTARILREKIAQLENPEEMKEKIITLFNSFGWEYKLTDTYSLQEKFYSAKNLADAGIAEEPEHNRKSIAQIVELPDMEKFYKELQAFLNIQLDIPPPHITVFAWSDYLLKATRGIGIYSQTDFDANHKKYI